MSDPNFLNRWLGRKLIGPLRRSRASITIPFSKVNPSSLLSYNSPLVTLRFVYALSNNVSLRFTQAQRDALDDTVMAWMVCSLRRDVSLDVSGFDLQRYNIIERFRIGEVDSLVYEHDVYDGQKIYGSGMIIEGWYNGNAVALPETDMVVQSSILGSEDIRYQDDFVMPTPTFAVDFMAPNTATAGSFSLPMVFPANTLGNITQIRV